jgi:hypothetical protein
MKIFTKRSTYKKVAGKIAKPIALAAKIGGTALAVETLGLPMMAGYIGLGLAKKYGEKYLDKKLGKYKSYRVARAGIDTADALRKGSYAGAYGAGSKLYSELDPNKKRVARFGQFNENYVNPSLQIYGAAKSGRKVGSKGIKRLANPM